MSALKLAERSSENSEMKNGICSSSGRQEPERVDLLALVEGHHLLVHALLVVLVALLDLLDLGLQRLEALHRLHALERERQDRRAGP